MRERPRLPEEVTIHVSKRAADAYRGLDENRQRLSEMVMSRWLENEAQRGVEARMRFAEMRAEPDEWPIEVPVDPGTPDGPFVQGSVNWNELALWYTDEHGVGIIDLPFGLLSREQERASWLRKESLLFVKVDRAGRRLRVIGPATSEDARRYRAPVWIQGPEIPTCCGMQMNFVGQIDDDDACRHAPPGAVLWWHDVASFYVFTCAICLEMKAIGQQY